MMRFAPAWIPKDEDALHEPRDMRIILNMTRIGRSGGGLQNALSFLRTLPQVEDRDAFVVGVNSGALRDNAVTLGYSTIPARRYRGLCDLDWRCRKYCVRGQVCFTMFGHPWARASGHLINVVGVALSNLFYPEIPFWSDYTPMARVQRRLVDLTRQRGIQLADYWIFETEVLRHRAIDLCHFPEERVGVVKMAPSTLVSPERVDEVLTQRYDGRIPHAFRFLFLNGAQPNKRIHVLPQIAKAMVAQGCQEFCFVTTMPLDHAYARKIQDAFMSLGLSAHFCNLGPIAPTEVSSLISVVDAMCTLSRLESFSNNFVEAWKMQRPLVVTDADWARESCGTSALYVDPERSPATAQVLRTLIGDAHLRSALVKEGTARLLELPSPEHKTQLYLEHVEKARELGPCPKHLRAKIRWPKVQKA
jgi:hypothetical protein